MISTNPRKCEKIQNPETHFTFTITKNIKRFFRDQKQKPRNQNLAYKQKQTVKKKKKTDQSSDKHH